MKNKKQKKRKEVVEEDDDGGKDAEITVETEVEVQDKNEEEDEEDKKEVIGLEDGEDAPPKSKYRGCDYWTGINSIKTYYPKEIQLFEAWASIRYEDTVGPSTLRFMTESRIPIRWLLFSE